MAAVTASERTAAQHQSLLHFVGEGRWSDEKVLAKVREMDSHDAKAMGIPTRTVTSASIHY
jgi:SRSO17 transposase